MTDIFTRTDEDGDRLTVRESYDGNVLTTSTDGDNDDRVSVRLDPDAITTLREALKPFDPAECDGTATCAPCTAPTIEVGREYRLLPGAHCRLSTGVRLESFAGVSVSRVRVTEGPDSSGDYWVTALDGDPGRTHSTDPAYLAPLDEAAPTPLDEWRTAMRTWQTVAGTFAGTFDAPAPADAVDPARVAAWEKAREMVGTAARDARDILDLAWFLSGADK